MTDDMTLAALIAGRTSPGEERRVLDLLAAASAADLMTVLETCDVDALVSGLDDRVVGPDHRSALIQLLAHDRRDDPLDRGDLTLVTARPMDLFGLLENHSRASSPAKKPSATRH